jgi:hypothetical protein
MAKAKVHRLFHTGPIVEPDAEMVANLQKLLREARRREIKGFGYFVVKGNDSLMAGWNGGVADRHDMVAGAVLLKDRIVRAWIDRDA